MWAYNTCTLLQVARYQNEVVGLRRKHNTLLMSTTTVHHRCTLPRCRSVCPRTKTTYRPLNNTNDARTFTIGLHSKMASRLFKKSKMTSETQNYTSCWLLPQCMNLEKTGRMLGELCDWPKPKSYVPPTCAPN